jgi:hypothetical protein
MFVDDFVLPGVVGSGEDGLFIAGGAETDADGSARWGRDKVARNGEGTAGGWPAVPW